MLLLFFGIISEHDSKNRGMSETCSKDPELVSVSVSLLSVMSTGKLQIRWMWLIKTFLRSLARFCACSSGRDRGQVAFNWPLKVMTYSSVLNCVCVGCMCVGTVFHARCECRIFAKSHREMFGVFLCASPGDKCEALAGRVSPCTDSESGVLGRGLIVIQWSITPNTDKRPVNWYTGPFHCKMVALSKENLSAAAHSFV